MNRLINKSVVHRDLGEGVIIDAADNESGIFITVNFPNSNDAKRFGLPMAFGKALESDEELIAIADDIIKAKDKAQEKAAAQKMEEEKKIEAEKRQELIRTYEGMDGRIDWNKQFGSNDFRIFKVHQGKTFQQEYTGRFVWAPASGIHHHEKMTDIHEGDIIFHYANGALVAISEAMSNWFHCPQPASLAGFGYGIDGYCAKVRYQMLTAPFSLDPLRASIISSRAGIYSSFDSNGDACQGYMYALELNLAKLFKNEILRTSQPMGVITVLGRIL